MVIVLLNGIAKSGKDEFIKQFELISPFKVHNISTIDQVKNIAKTFFGWDGSKDEKSRKFLAELKQLWIDYNNGPFECVVKKIEEIENISKDENIIFIHCREKLEINKFKDYYKGYVFVTLLVERDVPTPENVADLQVFDYKYDYTIENNGNISQLKKKAKEFYKYIMSK